MAISLPAPVEAGSPIEFDLTGISLEFPNDDTVYFDDLPYIYPDIHPSLSSGCLQGELSGTSSASGTYVEADWVPSTDAIDV